MNEIQINKIVSLISHKKFKQLLLLAVILLLWYVVQPSLAPTDGNSSIANNEIAANALQGDTALVSKDVDGDTFHYMVGTELHTVRLLGVDTPETKDPRKPVQCFGKEASAFTAGLIEGKQVKLEKDTKGDTIDKYGRELRYVFLPDGRMLNRILVAEGYAYATPEYTFSLKDEFVNLQKEADNAGKGLWSSCPIN